MAQAREAANAAFEFTTKDMDLEDHYFKSEHTDNAFWISIVIPV